VGRQPLLASRVQGIANELLITERTVLDRTPRRRRSVWAAG
jgi:hypothetical protein